MGTTLTGTTPQDTYDSLIKVTDNGPISGTLKALSDGLGNDSSLSLSTTAASVTGTLAVTAGVTLASASGNVGIGGTALTKFSVIDAANTYCATFDGSGGTSLVAIGTTSLGPTIAGLTAAGASATNLIINPDGGNVGIAVTGAPAVPLDVVGNIRSSTGILFGADTAAANLLDDYEEGTWTMGVSFGGASVGVTYDRNTGTYTKIGRQVTVNGYIILTSKGSSTGSARITGLPFTIQNANANYSASSLFFSSITFANQFQGFGLVNSTTIALEETTILGVNTDITNADFANNSQIMVSLTYFV
jgi:hypothetical protein